MLSKLHPDPGVGTGQERAAYLAVDAGLAVIVALAHRGVEGDPPGEVPGGQQRDGGLHAHAGPQQVLQGLRSRGTAQLTPFVTLNVTQLAADTQSIINTHSKTPFGDPDLALSQDRLPNS